MDDPVLGHQMPGDLLQLQMDVAARAGRQRLEQAGRRPNSLRIPQEDALQPAVRDSFGAEDLRRLWLLRARLNSSLTRRLCC